MFSKVREMNISFRYYIKNSRFYLFPKASRIAVGTFRKLGKACRKSARQNKTCWKPSRSSARTFQTRLEACCITARSYQTVFNCELCNEMIKNDGFVADFLNSLANCYCEKLKISK